MGEALLATSPGAERDARMLFWASYMRNYARPSDASPEWRIGRARDAYVEGRIDVETFEDRVAVALGLARSPQP